MQLPSHQLTSDRLAKLGTIRPILLLQDNNNDINGLPEGLHIPPQLQSLQSIIATSSAMQPGSIRIVDCTSQREQLNWTLHDWQHYWMAKTTDNDDGDNDNDKIRRRDNGMKEEGVCEVEDEVDSAAIVKIKIKGEHSPLLTNHQHHHSTFSHQSAMHKILELYIDVHQISSSLVAGGESSTFHPPRAVLDLDLKTHLSSSSSSPQSPVFFKMSPSRGFSEFSLQPCGSCQWIHSLFGTQTFALIPPTPANLSRFIRWASGQRRGTPANSLLTMCEGPTRADVPAGGTLFIPPGWIVGSVTTAASTVVVGQYLRSDSIAAHLESWRVEDFLGVHVAKRYPGFKALMWQFGVKLMAVLESFGVVGRGKLIEEEVEARAEGKRKAEEELRMEKKERRLERQRQRQQELMRQQQQQQKDASTRERGPLDQQHERTKKKRKASPGDSFIDSEEDDVGNYEDSEDGSWGGEPSPPYDEINDNDDDAFINEERGTSLGRNKSEKGGAKDGEEAGVLRAMAKQQQQPPPSRFHSVGKKNKVADWSEDDEEPEDSFDDAYYNNGAAPAPAGLGSPPQTIKLKLKLPTTNGDASNQQQPVQQPMSFKIKIKPASIPQLDGAFDDDGDLDLDILQPTMSLPRDEDKPALSESEKSAAAALIPILKQWIRSVALEGNNSEYGNQDEQRQLYGGLPFAQAQLLPYKLEILMEAACIPSTPPSILPELVPREDISTEDEDGGSGRMKVGRKGGGLMSEGGDRGVSSPVLSPMDVHLASTGDGGGGDGEDGDEFVPGVGLGIGGRGGDGKTKKVAGGGMSGGVKKPGKQLSVKNRLMKKLGMKK